MVCVSSAAAGGATKSAGPNIGAIAGGVVGGVALIALLTFALWWFWIRPKKAAWYEEEWEQEDENDATAKTQQFQQQRDDRRSVHSVASTVLSRASNMIPIAFIPGVTNRDNNAPPVPPIPAARNYQQTPISSQQHNGDAIFFSPSDLGRNSTYSETSSLRNRDTFIGRPSISASLARESVASDIYQDNATEHPMPALQAMRARPNMVSVLKSGAPSPRSGPSPLGTQTHTPSSNDYSSAVSAATPSIRSKSSFVKPTPVTIVKKTSTSRFQADRPEVSSPLTLLSPATDVYDTDDEGDEPHARARQSLLNNRDSSATTIHDTPVAAQSPFADRRVSRADHGGLSAVIEEATRRASRMPKHNGLGGRDDPFGDEHASEAG